MDEKIEKNWQELSTKINSLTSLQGDFEGELKQNSKEIDQLTKKFNRNLTNDDGKKIWRHFQRFAEYNDLKELYSKCIP